MKLAALALIASVAAPAPELCTLRPEFSQREGQSWLAARTPETCRHRVSELAAAIEGALRNIPPGTTLQAIFIGRLISYPELSESLKQLASSEVAWDKKTGKGRPSDNAVVARLLMASPEVAPLRAAIEKSGYRLRAFSVEKVLVAPSEGALLPFDALTHLVVEQP
jgi:hypothetical protein